MQSFLLLALSLGLFENSSVATAEGAASAFLNPAGFSIRNGLEFMGSWRVSDLDTAVTLSLSLRNLGFGAYRWRDTAYYQLSASFKLKNSFYFGYSWDFGDKKGVGAGFTFRPWNFLSLGAAAGFPKGGPNSARFGLGLRPLGNFLTLYGDLLYADSIENYWYGLSLEPLKGVVLMASSGKDEKIRVGLELRTGFSRASFDYRKDEVVSSVCFSNREYPSALTIHRAKVVKLKLSGSYPEERKRDFIGRSKGKSFPELIDALKKVRDDKSVKALLVEMEYPRLGMAQREELRNILAEIKEKGKKIYVNSDDLSITDYYLASVADRILLSPSGDVAMPGICFRKIYLKGTLEKLGIETEIERVGEYKSAVEPFLRENMSEADREQESRLLEVFYDEITGKIKGSRKFKSLDELIDEGYFNSDEALEKGLVDSLLFPFEVEDLVKEDLGKRIKFVDLWKYYGKKPYNLFWGTPPVIAVLTAEGGIVTGEGGRSFLTGTSIGSDAMVRVLEKLRKDKNVKAVVIRVNSPGGSALASEIIAGELRKVKKEKPVVVSMGNVAASGGYYISCDANEILADRTTITGSIGILAVKFYMKELYNKLGFTSDLVKKGKHADAFSTWRRMTDEERKKFREEINWGYWTFVKRVASGRNLNPEKVDSMARGRVWAGSDAEERKLVDSIGGLKEAIEKAKELAEIKGAFDIRIYPLHSAKFPLLTSASDHLWPLSLLRESRLYLMPVLYSIGN